MASHLSRCAITTNKGVQPILDAVIDFLPSPVDRGEIKGVSAKDETKEESPRWSLIMIVKIMSLSAFFVNLLCLPYPEAGCRHRSSQLHPLRGKEAFPYFVV